MSRQSTTGESNVRYGWANPLKTVESPQMPADMININLHGRAPTSPQQGFGRMWLRTYRVALPTETIDPHGLMDIWKADFPSFWPQSNRFATAGVIQPGEVGLINLSMPAGLKLATGARVIYVDETAFMLSTIMGHMFCGWITFSSYTEGEYTYAQTQALIRPGDALYELSFLLGLGSKAEDSFWHQSLKNLAARFNIQAEVEQVNRMVDPHLQWRNFGNIWYNAGVWSALHQLSAPLRWLSRSKKRGTSDS